MLDLLAQTAHQARILPPLVDAFGPTVELLGRRVDERNAGRFAQHVQDIAADQVVETRRHRVGRQQRAGQDRPWIAPDALGPAAKGNLSKSRPRPEGVERLGLARSGRLDQRPVDLGTDRLHAIVRVEGPQLPFRSHGLGDAQVFLAVEDLAIEVVGRHLAVHVYKGQSAVARVRPVEQHAQPGAQATDAGDEDLLATHFQCVEQGRLAQVPAVEVNAGERRPQQGAIRCHRLQVLEDLDRLGQETRGRIVVGERDAQDDLVLQRSAAVVVEVCGKGPAEGGAQPRAELHRGRGIVAAAEETGDAGAAQVIVDAGPGLGDGDLTQAARSRSSSSCASAAPQRQFRLGVRRLATAGATTTGVLPMATAVADVWPHSTGCRCAGPAVLPVPRPAPADGRRSRRGTLRRDRCGRRD